MKIANLTRGVRTIIVALLFALGTSATTLTAHSAAHPSTEAAAIASEPCQSPQASNTIKQSIDVDSALSEIARSTNFGLPERFANHVRGSTSFHSTTTHYEDGTRSIFILGYGLADSVGVVNTYDSGGALMHVSALRAEAIDQSVSITDRYATVMPRSGVCKNWDRTCQKSKIRNCPNGWCGTLLWNPAAAAICAINTCGISLGSCCLDYIAPGDDLGNLHD